MCCGRYSKLRSGRRLGACPPRPASCWPATTSWCCRWSSGTGPRRCGQGRGPGIGADGSSAAAAGPQGRAWPAAASASRRQRPPPGASGGAHHSAALRACCVVGEPLVQGSLAAQPVQPRRHGREPARAGPRPGAAPTKRNAHETSPLGAAASSLVPQIWVDCGKIVQDLLKNQQTKIYFGEPVKESYVPNYYSVIKNPMDLGTIKGAPLPPLLRCRAPPPLPQPPLLCRPCRCRCCRCARRRCLRLLRRAGWPAVGDGTAGRAAAARPDAGQRARGRQPEGRGAGSVGGARVQRCAARLVPPGGACGAAGSSRRRRAVPPPPAAAKVEGRRYSTVYEFRDDMRLTFNNCRIFNPPGARRSCRRSSCRRRRRRCCAHAPARAGGGRPAPLRLAPRLACRSVGCRLLLACPGGARGRQLGRTATERAP